MMIGKTLVHYEITAEIGKGGMGEVYQAKDTKLGRDVAIKVLPEEFALDTDRVARFQREAKLLASLNHPNIAAIYGLEESEGTHFLVMELIEGDTLRDRIKSGPIPVEEAMKLALQMAEALEAAHEKGVIHRDLKPANIKVTPEGKVKILDFGLAKAYVGDQENLSPMDSPTISAAATQKGVILGTAAYMSPEQARGKPVDKRADIWAFGCVLYEMLTGKSAFQGEDISETLAAVIRAEPEWKNLPTNLHWRLKEVLERCLEKEAKNRYSGMSDSRVDIQKVLDDPSGVLAQPVTTTKPYKKIRLGLPWVAAVFILGLIVAGVAGWYLKPAEQRQVTRFSYELPKDLQFGNLTELTFAVSPDGRQLVFCTNAGLYLRSMDELDARLIAGTEGAQKPFFSPDAKWVGYVSDGQLKKIAITGGAPVVLTNVGGTAGFIDWGSDDMVAYSDLAKGISRVSANGGNPEAIVKLENILAISPQVLPDGRSVLFTSLSTLPSYTVMVQSLESGERKELFQGDTARYIPTGHLVYAVENDLFAIPFDLDKLEVAGGPISMVEGVFRAGGAPQYGVSDSGTLAFIPGTTPSSGVKAERSLVLVDRNGKEETLTAALNAYAYPKISPDGTKVAVTIADQSNANIWIWDLVRKTMTRLTFDEYTDFAPLWSPDGKRIAFFSVGEGETGIYWKAADGTGETELLTSDPNHILLPFSWSGDGNTLCFMEFSSALPLSTMTTIIVAALTTPTLSLGPAPDAKSDIGVLSMEGKRERKLLLQDKYLETQPEISPDGKWIAYSSDESSQFEVYVRPFPEVHDGKWQISTGGGDMPTWSPDGGQLFYRSGDAMMAVSVETGTTFKASAEQRLFQRSYYPDLLGGMWDIHPDGKRFLMIKPSAPTDEGSTDAGATEETPRKIIIVQNWFEELKERVPVD